MFDLDAFLQTSSTVIASWAPKVVGAGAVLIVGWVLAGWAKRFARKALYASRVDDILVPFISGMIYVAVIVLVGVTAVGVLGVSTASFVAILGAAGLAIALAFQSTFSNFASGVMLLTFRPFDVGHTVEIGGVLGTVREVGTFTCLLTTPDNIQIRIPNSQIFGATIKNYSASETRRIDLLIGVDYGDDLGVAVRTCQDVVAADPRVLDDPVTVVAVHELGDSSVNLVVRPWVTVADYWPTRWDLTRAIKEQLEAAGCSIPFPQRDVHLHQPS
ncbi:MAG: mechanosensitive ion channel [Gemmatimonadota bacterium]|nr:mechanosensitive ion channel [Gemmatimonadota bacterium]MDH3423823.1 mechanosensitive ion channel [Gemmatimonadota bacterium]